MLAQASPSSYMRVLIEQCSADCAEINATTAKLDIGADAARLRYEATKFSIDMVYVHVLLGALCACRVSLAGPGTEATVDATAVPAPQSVFEALDVYAGLSSGKAT